MLEALGALISQCGMWTGMDTGLDAVRLIDDQTYETLHRFELEADERGTALTSASFADEPAMYYVLGTAYELANEPEPTRVLTARSAWLCLVV